MALAHSLGSRSRYTPAARLLILGVVGSDQRRSLEIHSEGNIAGDAAGLPAGHLHGSSYLPREKTAAVARTEIESVDDRVIDDWINNKGSIRVSKNFGGDQG